MWAEIQNRHPMNIYVTPPPIAFTTKKNKQLSIFMSYNIEDLLVFLLPIH